MVATIVAAEEARPANTLMDMRRQFGACMSGRPIGPSGSALTIVLMMKRDGSIFGKPRITFSRLEGDDEARQRFLDDAERAIDSCVPFRVTPALGGAIAVLSHARRAEWGQQDLEMANGELHPEISPATSGGHI